MTADNSAKSVSRTLSTTVADTITINQLWPALEVTNLDATNWLYFRQDGTTAVGAAKDCTAVPPLTSKVVAAQISNATPSTHVISVVGSGNAYTIEGVN